MSARFSPTFPARTVFRWVVLSAALACGEGAADAPADGRASKNDEVQVEVVPERIEKGAELFKENCVSCHGEDGTGRVGIGPKVNSKSWLSAVSDQSMITTISEGRRGTTMLAWKKLGGENVKNLVAYIRSLTPHERAVLDESPLRGRADKGAVLFRTICAQCHGRSGAGYQESSSGTGIGRKVFLDAFSNGFLRYVIKQGKSLSKMRSFEEKSSTAVANLTDQDIEDIVTFLRRSAW